MSRLIRLFSAILLVKILGLSAHAQEANFRVFSDLRPVVKKTTVFIPGIMGSRLQVGDEVVWGKFPYDPNLLVYLGDDYIANAAPLESVELSKWIFRDRAYGSYFRDIYNDLEADDWFRPFAYDWRASNETSASYLDSFLCNEVDHDRGPILLVAHSMGGLVLKLWLMNHYESGCSGNAGRKVPIAGIVFVATPHFGAPDTVTTIMTGSPGLFPILEDVFMPEMAVVGLSFDSIYELLPMQHAYDGSTFEEGALCMTSGREASGSQRWRVFHRGSNGEDVIVNLYSTTVWRRLGLFNRIEELLSKYDVSISTSRDYLQSKLDAARRVSCKLAGFRMPDELSDKVSYLAGSLLGERVRLATTVDEVLISDIRLPNANLEFEFEDGVTLEPKYLYINYGAGDATVPEDIATFGKDQFARRDNADHIEILNSVAFLDMIELAQRRADIHGDLNYGLKIDPIADRPILEVSEILRDSGISVPLKDWLEIESVGGSNRIRGINIDSLSRIAGMMTDEQRNAVLTKHTWSSGELKKVFSGEIATNNDAIAAIKSSEELSGEDFHFFATIAQLPELYRAGVALSAADRYFLSSKPELAGTLYELAGVYAASLPSSDVEAAIAERAMIGSYISSDVVVRVDRGGGLADGLAQQWTDYLAEPGFESLAEMSAAFAEVEKFAPTFSVNLADVTVDDRLGGD